MKRFFFLSTLFIVLVSVPIYAASKIFLPEWLKDEVISKLPLGTELSVGQVSSNYDLSILYEDVIYNSPGYKLEFDNFLIELNHSQILKLNYQNYLNYSLLYPFLTFFFTNILLPKVSLFIISPWLIVLPFVFPKDSSTCLTALIILERSFGIILTL